ncbi:MAG: DUF58 domain-containing protein [Alicyclobacillus sp.]|nr:DUF58 domain-containing protein [Alicyclobacillus sp.]
MKGGRGRVGAWTWRKLLAGAFGMLCLAATFVFAKVQGGFFAWFLFAFVGVLFAYEVVTAAVGLRGVTVERRLSAKRLSAGQTLQIDVELSVSGAWPRFWLRVRDALPPRFAVQVQGSERVLLPVWARRLGFRYRIENLPRGIYRIGDSTLETGDLLGILQLRRTDHRSDLVTVYPRVVPVRGWSGQLPEELGLREATRRRSDESTTVLGVRDYVPGDRLSRVHWKASARRGTLLAKDFEMHVSSELMFVPDLSRDSYRGFDGRMFELAMTIVASLMKYAFERRRRFGLLMAALHPVHVPPGGDETLLVRCMEELAMASPEGRHSFPEVLQRAAQEVPLGTVLVVVSPLLAPMGVVAVEHVRRRNPVEWFAPLAQHEFTQDQQQALAALRSIRVPCYPVRQPEQLSQLARGGNLNAAHGSI